MSDYELLESENSHSTPKMWSFKVVKLISWRDNKITKLLNPASSHAHILISFNKSNLSPNPPVIPQSSDHSNQSGPPTFYTNQSKDWIPVTSQSTILSLPDDRYCSCLQYGQYRDGTAGWQPVDRLGDVTWQAACCCGLGRLTESLLANDEEYPACSFYLTHLDSISYLVSCSS